MTKLIIGGFLLVASALYFTDCELGQYDQFYTTRINGKIVELPNSVWVKQCER